MDCSSIDHVATCADGREGATEFMCGKMLHLRLFNRLSIDYDYVCLWVTRQREHKKKYDSDQPQRGAVKRLVWDKRRSQLQQNILQQATQRERSVEPCVEKKKKYSDYIIYTK